MILTGRQFREGRLLAGMTQADLAEAAGVELALVVRTEGVDGLPMIAKRDAKAITATVCGSSAAPQSPPRPRTARR